MCIFHICFIKLKQCEKNAGKHSFKIVNTCNFKYMLCKQHFWENREKKFLQKTPFLFISENENFEIFSFPFFALTATMRYFIASHFLHLNYKMKFLQKILSFFVQILS